MARAKTNRQLRRESPPPKPIVLPVTADEADTPVAETRSAPAPQAKQKKSQGPSTAKTKRQRDKALKGAEFAAKLETKSSRREDRKAKKQTAKKLWE